MGDISHWASSSSQNATCSFEPDTTEDLAVGVSHFNDLEGVISDPLWQFNVISALRQPFAVSFYFIKTNWFDDIRTGQKRWSYYESRIFVHDWRAHLNVSLFRHNL